MTPKEDHDYREMGLMLFLAMLAIFALFVVIIQIKLECTKHQSFGTCK